LVELLPVHIGVLTIADDAAVADRTTAAAIAERATAVGHKIVDEELVGDNETAIRDQLVRWISHENIDVVIVAAGVESDAASTALAPLIMQTLPGFTDLFRWLTFQEIGASAMLSAAEAAQCQGTFVFVLPAHAGAVRAAMDKLILPQLDIRTKPKNLVAQMPRLREAAKKLVPDKSQPIPTTRATPPSVPIAKITPPSMVAAQPPVSSRPDTEPNAVPVPVEPATDKTQGGAGLPPKLPAQTSQPTRSKPRTANTIARQSDDPPTKPIDLAKLEKQIALSTQNDAQTKQISLSNDAKTKVVDMSAHQAKTRVVDSSRLPRVPPGADESALQDDEALTFTAPPRTSSSARSPSSLGTAKPAQIPPVRQTAATPAFATPVARSTPGPRAAVATPPLGTPLRNDAKTPAVAVPVRDEAKPVARDDAKTPPIVPIRPASAQPTVTIPARSATPARGVAPPPRMTAATPAVAPATVVGPAPAPQPPVLPSVRVTQATPVVPPPSPPPAVMIAPRQQRPPTPPPVPAGAIRGAKRPATAPTHDEAVTTPAGKPFANDDEAVTTRAASPIAPATVVVDEEAPTTRDPPRANNAAANAGEVWPRSMTPPQEVPARIEPPVHVPAPAPAPASNLFASEPARVRKPTAPPPTHHDPLAGVTSKPIGVVELPHGDFVYPSIKKSGSGALIKILLALVALAGGFFAFIKLYPMATERSEQAVAVTPPAPAPVAAPEPAAEPTPTPPIAEVPPPEPPPVENPEPIEMEPAVETPPDKPPTAKPATKPRTRKPKGEPSVTPPSDPGDASVTKPPPEPPVKHVDAPEGCDEVSCVLSKYDKPCCERYRPADRFTPKNVTPETLDRAMVKSGVEKIKPKVVACGEKSGVKGMVRLAVVVEPDGSVKSVDVSESPDAALGECVAGAMRRAKFGKTINGADFSYPFAF
jgi:molybdenum cofactor biosynthesis protein B